MPGITLESRHFRGVVNELVKGRNGHRLVAPLALAEKNVMFMLHEMERQGKFLDTRLPPLCIRAGMNSSHIGAISTPCAAATLNNP
jgi:hypothetical protein